MDYVDKIAKAIGDERGEVFRSLVAFWNLRDDEPDLALAAATASLMVDFREVVAELKEMRTENAELREAIAEAPSEWKDILSVEIAKAVGMSMDAMAGEIQTQARDVANSQYSAAALVRTRALNDEVAALTTKIQEFERMKAEAATGSTSAASGGVSWLWIATTAVVAFVTGMVIWAKTHPVGDIVHAAVMHGAH